MASDRAVLDMAAASDRLFRRERVFRDRQNPLEVFPAEEVRRKFRFWPSTILVLCQIFEDIGPSTKRSQALPTLLRVCVGLRFLASGAFNHIVGDLWPIIIDDATVHRTATKFVDAVCRVHKKWISFKDSQDPAFLHRKQAFYELYGKYEYDRHFPHLFCTYMSQIKVPDSSSLPIIRVKCPCQTLWWVDFSLHVALTLQLLTYIVVPSCDFWLMVGDSLSHGVSTIQCHYIAALIATTACISQ